MSENKFDSRGTLLDTTPTERSGLDILGWLRTLRRHKGLIAAIFVVGIVISYVVVNDITPEYTASAKLIIETTGSNVVDFEAVLTGVGTDSAAVASQLEILTSRTLLGRLADKLELDQDPEFNPFIRPDEPSFWDALSLTSLLPDWALHTLGMSTEAAEPLSGEELELAQRRAIIDNLNRVIEVQAIRPTYVISVSASSIVPRKAALIANTLASLYILDQLEAKFEATEQANTWLSERLQDLRSQVVEAESLVSAYRVEQRLGSDTGESLIEQQLNQANAQLTIARSEVAAAQANYSQIQSLLQNQGVDSAAQVLDSPLIQQLRQQESQAKRTLAELSTRYGERHPEIINAKAEIAELQNTIEGEVAKIVQNLSNEVAVARARASSINQTVEQLNAQFDGERNASVRLRELEREAEATRQLYDTMLSRYKETSEQQDLQQPDARIISEATSPYQPSSPKKQLILVLSGMAALLFGITLAFLLEHLRSGFRSLEQAGEVLRLPGFVEVPILRSAHRKAPYDQMLAHPTSPFSESVRSVQTALVLSNVDNPPKVVALVSSVPEEGKSALAASLGYMMASSGRRIALVDCDLRRPQQHRTVGRKRGPGLTEILSGEQTWREVANVQEETGLTVISAGAEVPNPHHLLQSNRMKELLAELGQEFDMVLLDTPAIMALSDGLIVAAIADATLMLVRWEKTPREVANTVVNSLRSVGARIVGVVLTQVDQRKQAVYGYSSYGYYHSRYKKYYNK